MLVHQVVVRDVQVIEPDAMTDEAARMMADLDIGARLVIDSERRLIGAVTLGDLQREAAPRGGRESQ